MKGSEILNQLLIKLGLNANQLAKELGMQRTQGIYDILDDKVGVSKNMAQKIVTRFPHVNRSYLLTGEGEILKPVTPQASTNEELVQIANTKMMIHELAKIKAKVFGMSYEDCLTEMEQNATLIMKDLLKGKP